MTEQEQKQFDQLTTERDNVTKERDAAIAERDNVTKERDAAIAERDNVTKERDAAITERDNVTKERDEIKKKYADNFAKGEKEDAEKLEKEVVDYFKNIF